MIRYIFISICCLICFLQPESSTAQLTFQKTFGHSNGSQANCIFQDNSGGYLLAGWYDVTSLFTAEFYLARLDANADTLWTRTFGSAIDTSANLTFNGSGNEGYKAIQTTDGGYAFIGERHDGPGEPSDVYLIKVNNIGQLEWARAYGDFSNEYGLAIEQTADGGFAIGGFTESYGAGVRSMYLMKVDELGFIEWTRTYGGDTINAANAMRLTSDGGFILVGYTFSFGAGSSDVYVIKTNSTGQIEWEYTYGGLLNDIGHAVTLANGGGYLIAGESESFGMNGRDFYLLKINNNGELEWSQTYGGDGYDAAKSIVQTADNNIAVLGHTRSFGAGNEDFYLVNVNDQGALNWSTTYGGNEDDAARHIAITNDAGFIMSGYTRSFGEGNLEMYLIKTDSLGNSGCNQPSPDTQLGNPMTISNVTTSLVGEGGALKAVPTLIGFTNTFESDPCEIISTTNILPTTADKFSFEIYPNPAQGKTTLLELDNISAVNKQVYIYDLLGQLKTTKTWTGTELEFDTSNWPSGTYFVKIIADNQQSVYKLIKQQ